MTTICQVNNKVDEVNKEMFWKIPDITEASEVWKVVHTYQRISDADKLTAKAFARKWMKNFLNKNKEYDSKLIMLTNKSAAANNREYVANMQLALQCRIAEASSVEWNDNVLVSNNQNIVRDWRNKIPWLSKSDIQFIDDLYMALNDFTNTFYDNWLFENNTNLWIMVRNWINNAIVNQSLWTERNPNEWSRLWQFIALASSAQWTNNILWLLWILDAESERDASELHNPDWTIEKVMIRDIYSSDNERMQKAVSLLFDVDPDNPNKWIIYNPDLYRRSFKTMMKATEVDWFTRWLNTILKLSAMWKLSSYTLWAFFGRLSWCMMWLSCFYTWYLNMMSYKKKNSNKKLHHALKLIWLWWDYFDFWESPSDWIMKRLSYAGNALLSKDPRKWNVNDPTRSQNFVARFTRNHLSQLSWMLMWVANIFWDAVFRWEYQLIAMDFALQKLWWDAWSLETHLYNVVTVLDENGKPTTVMELNEDALYTLLDAYIKKMADVTWFPQVEWGWQSWIYFDTDWKSWRSKTWRVWMNAALQMWRWMSQWWTTYVNNTYKILAWWTVNMIYDFVDTFHTDKKTSWNWKRTQYNKAYNWPWWDWLIKKYTRQVDTDWMAMPWEAAQELVSKQEYAREVARLLAWIRNMYRLWNMACRDEETWEFDIRCAVKNFSEVAYLPWQALRMAHPIIRWILNTVRTSYENMNYFWDRPELKVKNTDIIEESLITNILKPMLRCLYPIKELALAYDKWFSDYNEDTFMERLMEVVMESTDAMLYYTADELASYVYSAWAYWPKSYLNQDTTIFWTPNTLRDTMWRINKIKSVERVSRDWRAARLSDLFPTIRLFFNLWDIVNWEYDTTDFYAADKADKFLAEYFNDPWIQSLENWTITDEMKSNYDYMQYVWENLTSDWQSYWADFKNWVRDNKYNKSEIEYFEVLLQKDLADARKYNNQATDLQIYDAALKKFFAWTPTYNQIKEAIQIYNDAWEHWMWAYTDYLASAHWMQETTWVKWLALIAEYLKRQYMEEEWLQYSTSNTAWDEAKIKLIENRVAWELWWYLRLADRRQYSNLMWRWFVEKHPEYKNYDPFEWLIDKDWNRNVHWDVKQSWVLWTALWANQLARSELITWNTNWYELANVVTEKFWSPFDKDWNFDEVKAAQVIDTVTLLDQALEDAEKTPMERSLIEAPILTRYLDMFTWVLSSDNPRAVKYREQVWESIIDNIRWLLYDTYNDITTLPELLDNLNNEDVINKILWKWNKKYKWSWHLYYWNNTRKSYDYYKSPSDVFKAWWSENLSKFANGYGKWKSRYAWNYSDKEFYFLNQRCYRNPVNSTRIAPDIPLNIWGFSKTTVKSKNPVSWFTTNIKPRKERATPKFGKGKSIVWWEWSRWPVTNFKA